MKKNNDSAELWNNSLNLFNNLLGKLNNSQMVPVETEGKELVETPDKNVYSFKGPSHKQGGIDVMLPENSKIYSKRVKVNGVSMADRKKNRERKKLTLNKLLDNNHSDEILKNTASRVDQANQMQDNFDTQIQTMLHMLSGSIPKEKFALGGFLSSLLKPGNISSLFGDLISTLGPSQVTHANNASNTPNINTFENFGQRGLKTLDSTSDYLRQDRDNQLKSLNMSRKSQIARNNNSARGINTLRALNMATDQNVDNTRTRINDSFARNNANLLFQKANMQNQQDRVVMEGERQRDLANRMDRDNYFTQLSADTASQGRGFQEIGKDLNSIQKSSVMSNLINQLSNFFGVDENGKLFAKKQ